MKTTGDHSSPMIVPIESSYLQKEYGLTPVEAKNAMKKMSNLYAKRKADGKIIHVKDSFNEIATTLSE